MSTETRFRERWKRRSSLSKNNLCYLVLHRQYGEPHSVRESPQRPRCSVSRHIFLGVGVEDTLHEELEGIFDVDVASSGGLFEVGFVFIGELLGFFL